jgi:hypothetical protein
MTSARLFPGSLNDRKRPMSEPIARHDPQLRPARTGCGPQGIRSWNNRQMKTFRRYGSLFRVPLTADVVAPLATRYAAKHATTRPRLLSPKPSF